MKVKLRIESRNKVVNEIDKNINSIIGLIATSIDEEILSDDTVNEIMDCIKSGAECNIENIRKIVKEQKAEYETKINDMQNKINELKYITKNLKEHIIFGDIEFLSSSRKSMQKENKNATCVN